MTIKELEKQLKVISEVQASQMNSRVRLKRVQLIVKGNWKDLMKEEKQVRRLKKLKLKLLKKAVE